MLRKAEWREAELALVHDAYRQDHAPRAEEVAEKNAMRRPRVFGALRLPKTNSPLAKLARRWASHEHEEGTDLEVT